jgi:hypothetical protein
MIYDLSSVQERNPDQKVRLTRLPTLSGGGHPTSLKEPFQADPRKGLFIAEEDLGEELEGMYAPGCPSRDQSRIGGAGGLTNPGPFTQQSPLGRSSVLDPDILSGRVPISAIPSEQLTLLIRGGEDDVVSVMGREVHRFMAAIVSEVHRIGQKTNHGVRSSMVEPIPAFGPFGIAVYAIRQFFGPFVCLQARSIQPDSRDFPLTCHTGQMNHLSLKTIVLSCTTSPIPGIAGPYSSFQNHQTAWFATNPLRYGFLKSRRKTD